MKTILRQIGKLLFSGVVLSGLLTGCGDLGDRSSARQKWMQSGEKVKVLSTTAMIDDLVKAVGGEHVETHVLIKGELDPHSYQLVKGDDELLAIGDIIFYNGLGLEHGPSLQSYLTAQKKAIPLGNKIMKDHPEKVITVLGTTDPHIWMDISLWSLSVPYIVETLSEKDSEHAEEYRSNGEKLKEQMAAAHQNVVHELHKVPSDKRYLVTSHDAFNYFTRAYLAEEGEKDWSKRFSAPEGLAPESQISSSDIREILNHLAQYNIKVIFPESNVSRDSIKKIVDAAREHKMDVRIADVSLYADAMGKPGSDGDTYLKMIEHDARAIAGELLQNGGRTDREPR